jgi:RNA polymerase sigma-70 factor (ECF subfamily)
MEVATVLDDARGGDQQAFMLLLEPALAQGYRLAAAMLRSEFEAEDAVQDAVLSAWRHIGRFRPDGNIVPWFLAIVANRCRSYQRSRWWSVVRGEIAVDGESRASVDPAVTDLRRALYRLPQDQRMVLVLRYYLDLPFEEVGAVLGISAKAAKSRTHRALARLRLLPEVSVRD